MSPGGSHDRDRDTERCDRPHAHGPELPARPPPPRQPGADARGREGDQHRASSQAARRSSRGNWSRRRPPGHADPRGVVGGGDPQRLRPHRGRVAHVDRRRRPGRGHLHRDKRVGPARDARGARDAAREAPLPRPRRELCRVRGHAAAGRRRGVLRGGDPGSEPARRPDASSTPRENRSAAESKRSRSSSPRTRARRKTWSARSWRRGRISPSRSRRSPSSARGTC